MSSVIIKPYPDYYMGALKFPKAVVHHAGDNFVVHTDGRIFNCHPYTGGVWPIRFEVMKHDENFQAVTDLFKEFRYKTLLQRALNTTEFNMDDLEDETIILIGEIKEELK